MSPGASEEVTGHAGLPLLLEALRALRLDEVVKQELRVAKRRRGFPELEKLEALAMLIASGADRVEDARILARDQGLWRMLSRSAPSPDALLDFLSGFDDPSVWANRPKDEASWVPPETPALKALATVLRASVARGANPGAKRATVDHDGTIIESHKRAATVAYEGTRGYQPLLAVWAEEDLVVADEFRDGNVPGGKDPLTSVRRAFECLPPTVTERYFRGDSADYYAPLLKYLVKEKVRFTISADMSPELSAVCKAVAEKSWENFEERHSEMVHLAEVEFTPGHWSKDARPLRYVAVRFCPRQQEMFEGEGGTKYLAVVSNREDLKPKELLRWHWGKAGTIEHVHRVLKDELGAGVMPSNRFGANAAWLRINVLTYNLLSVLRRRVLPERYHDCRPKRLRFDLFNVAGELTMHQSQLGVKLAVDEKRGEEIVVARERMALMRDELAPRPARAARRAPKGLRSKSPRRTAPRRP